MADVKVGQLEIYTFNFEFHPTMCFIVKENLYGKIEIGMVQASLGCKISVPTLEGKEEITIEKGTQSGEVVTQRQRNSKPSHKKRGDLFFEVSVLIPKRLTKQEELLKQFAAESGEKLKK